MICRRHTDSVATADNVLTPAKCCAITSIKLRNLTNKKLMFLPETKKFLPELKYVVTMYFLLTFMF